MTLTHYASLTMNAVGLVSNCYALYTLLWTVPPLGPFGGHFQFLTILGLSAATLAFMFNIIQRLVPGAFGSLYHVLVNIATPVEGLISILYWPMVLYNRDLLAPKDVAFHLPLKLDLSLHLWPAIILYTDFLLLNASFRRSSKDVLVIYAFTVFYFVWTWYCFTQNGFWPYPFLSVFSDVSRAVFFLCCGTVCALMYEGGAYLHAKLHDSTLQKKKQ